MYVVGIDFSLRYPSLCVSRDFEQFEFVGIVNTKMSKVNWDFLAEASSKYADVDFANIAEEHERSDVYHVNERVKLLNFVKIAGRVVFEIKKRTQESPEVVVAMEGISYGSKGSALLDICQATGILRHALLREVLASQIKKLFVFSPAELKNAIGLKGNATKTEIYGKFREDPGIAGAMNSGLYQMITENESSPYVYNEKKDEVPSPINDMLDAYLSVRKIYNNVS